jgi:hypothetical protein
MGPEAMGVANANLHWSDEKVCRNFLCGTCPHTLFTNTVRLTFASCSISLSAFYPSFITAEWLFWKLSFNRLELRIEKPGGQLLRGVIGGGC